MDGEQDEENVEISFTVSGTGRRAKTYNAFDAFRAEHGGEFCVAPRFAFSFFVANKDARFLLPLVTALFFNARTDFSRDAVVLPHEKVLSSRFDFEPVTRKVGVLDDGFGRYCDDRASGVRRG